MRKESQARPATCLFAGWRISLIKKGKGKILPQKKELIGENT